MRHRERSNFDRLKPQKIPQHVLFSFKIASLKWKLAHGSKVLTDSSIFLGEKCCKMYHF